MYLTSSQHDQFRTLIMGFEIPYRSYIADCVLSHYPDENSFLCALSEKRDALIQTDEISLLNGKLGKILKSSDKLFEALRFSKDSFESQKVIGEADVPMLGDLNTLTYVFRDIFAELIERFPDFTSFYNLASKYSYVRNKLDHPLCKILEDSDMFPVLNFVDEICQWLDVKYFWDKNKSEINTRILSLRTGKINIPIDIHNIPDMPFPDMRIVCRTQEIASIKEFIYGKPGALRKQSSYCIYGYGGLGKTALVLEVVKELIQDIINGTTINFYKPKFILFFTAKERKIGFSKTSGSLESITVRKSFDTFESLKNLIFNCLKIKDFVGFRRNGIIIIDNLETLSSDDRIQLHDFIQAGSPSNVQYILTSRKEEAYDINTELCGFEAESGLTFIKEYIDENDLAMEITDKDGVDLLQLSQGNTLVLVLCLCRLSHKLETIENIRADFSKLPTTKVLGSELLKLPPSGFEIISEFMFKNTFEEVELIFRSENEDMYKILQIFTVYDADSIDIYTVSMITNIPCQIVQQIFNVLCHYLIVERQGANYQLNQFAEKYIIQRFLPNTVKYASLQEDVEHCIRETKRELEAFKLQLDRHPDRKKILDDWHIITNGDKIAAAKIDSIYLNVRSDCSKGNKFFVQSSLEEALNEISLLEKTTIHPYIQYQKARIYKMIDDSNILPNKHYKEILDVFKSVIWTIKTNCLYSGIQHTKSYASILWIYGMRLISEDINLATRYLEDAKSVFEEHGINDDEYSNCLIDLLHAYIENYRLSRNRGYLYSAKQLDHQIYTSSYRTKRFWQLHDQLKLKS